LKSGILEQIPSEKILLIAEDLIDAMTAIQKAKAATSLEKLKKKGIANLVSRDFLQAVKSL